MEVVQIAFHRRADRAGVQHIGREVRATVDAGEHEVDGTVRIHERFEVELHAVRRRAGDAPGLGGAELERDARHFFDLDGTMDVQRVRHAALFVPRRGDVDFVRLRELRRERAQAFGCDAVVVRYQNAHGVTSPLSPSR